MIPSTISIDVIPINKKRRETVKLLKELAKNASKINGQAAVMLN